MRNMRHVVDVMRPTGAEGTRGERQGQDIRVRSGVSCSIETVSGGETEQARSTYPAATYKVTMYADHLKPVTPPMYLAGGTLGMIPGTNEPRWLNVLFVGDPQGNGRIHELICEEDLS